LDLVGRKVFRARQDRKESKGLGDSLGIKGSKERSVPPVLKGSPEYKDLKDLKVFREKKGTRAHKDLKANLA